MTISHVDAMRELHNYAMEEMRNRGLEEAAKAIEWRYRGSVGPWRIEAETLAAGIRGLKRDPKEKLSDWWPEKPIVDDEQFTSGGRE